MSFFTSIFYSCFIGDVGVFFGAFLGPILLIIVFNTVIYSLVIRVLVKHNLQKNKHKLNKSSLTALEVIKLILSICGIMFLFGLTWIFAIFTFVSSNRDVAFALQFIFALFNALQGFWIFFFFVLLNAEARESWKELLCPCRIKKEPPPTSKTDLSSKNKYFTGSKPKSSFSTNTSTGGLGTLEYNKTKYDKDNFSTELYSTVILEEDEPSDVYPDFMETREPEKKTYEELMQEEVEKDKPIQKARVQRHSTQRKKHDVEEIELDFFDSDEEN